MRVGKLVQVPEGHCQKNTSNAQNDPYADHQYPVDFVSQPLPIGSSVDPVDHPVLASHINPDHTDPEKQWLDNGKERFNQQTKIDVHDVVQNIINCHDILVEPFD